MKRRTFLTLVGSAALAGCSTDKSTPPVDIANGISISALPSEESEQQRLGRTFSLAGFQPTGRAIPAGTEFFVEVDRPGPHVELVIGAPGFGPTDPRVHPLTDKRFTVTDAEGGPLHIRHTGQASDEPVLVSFGPSVRELPFHRLGQPLDVWEQALAAAEDSAPVQLPSERAVFTLSAAAARQYLHGDIDQLLRTYDEIIGVEDAISGETDDDSPDRRSPLLYYVSQGNPGENPNATSYRVQYPSDSLDGILTVDGLHTSWGMWHELGHMHQQSAWEWDAVTEVTVNIYSLAVQRHFGEPSRLTAETEFDTAAQFLALPDDQRDYDALAADHPPIPNAGFFTMLVMFEQLRLGYGDDFYPNLHRLARRRSTAPNSEIPTGKDYLMWASSKASGADLTGFFTAWGLRPGESVRAAITALGLPPSRPDLTELRS
ncbi:M60 family metallopeptidase [Nocardia sp. NPDC059240]|uniref:M60 family metallopeptidase n=1 Tax=Nocardia sp. NPDC059240 TaxID=3346786 RepID=UPI00369ABB3F